MSVVAELVHPSAVSTDAVGWPSNVEACHEKEFRHLQRQSGQRHSRFEAALAQRRAEKREQARELGYPEYDPNFDDPAWLREQFKKEEEDPRENPNFFLDPKDPEFLNNAARKPYAKALLKCEAHWDHRRRHWLKQFGQVEDLNRSREEVTHLLEDCSVELKRLVAPVMKYKIMDIFLANVAVTATDVGMSFEDLLNEDETRSTLLFLRNQLDVGGAAAATELMNEFDMNFEKIAAIRRADDDMCLATPDAAALKEALNQASKCKKDGLLEWNNTNYEEAILSWREGNEAIKKLKAAKEFYNENAAVRDLHIALLKNISQAAIKLGYWNEALDAASAALNIDEEDHKAWFRKACALEGLGQIDEAENCLDRIAEIAVGRQDQERIKKDVETKRVKFETIRANEQASQKKMLQRGLQKGLFSDERDCHSLPSTSPPGPPAISSSVITPPKISNSSRKRLTKDGADAMLDSLINAYSDRSFQKQVKKLAHDVNHDQNEFLCYLSKVALPIQRPVLEWWGFDGSERGVSEMTRAIQDHTRGSNPDMHLRAKAEQAIRLLYGPMYDVVRAPLLTPAERQALSTAEFSGIKLKSRANCDGSGTESDRDNE